MRDATHATARFCLVFGLVFLCYQAAEGVGMRLLHSGMWQAVFMLATIPLALGLGHGLLSGPLRAFALEARPGALRWLLATFVLAVAGKALAVALGTELGIYSVRAIGAQPDTIAMLKGIALVLITTFVPSVAEDILTRGLLLRHGPFRTGMAFVALSTAVYVLNHIYRLGNGPMEWFMLACFGLAYALACVRADTLWAAVGLHWGWNAANGLLGSVADIDLLQREQGPLLSAGAHLVFAVVCLLATSDRTRRRIRAARSGEEGFSKSV